VIILRDLGQP
jgi:hypothetical protein